MAKKRQTTGATPNAEEAAVIKGMDARGDLQQWIVAWFGGRFNPGRINECTSGKRHPDIEPLAPDKLPPPGPYIGEIGKQRALTALIPASEAGQRAAKTIAAMNAAMQRAIQELSVLKAPPEPEDKVIPLPLPRQRKRKLKNPVRERNAKGEA